MTEDEILLEFHKIQVARSEHYEKERGVLSTLVLAVSSGLLALATFDQDISRSDSLLGILIVLCGALGYVGSRLHYHRSLRHGLRASNYRRALSATHPIVDQIKEETDLRHAAEGRKGDLRLHHLWLGLHAGLCLLGICVVAAAVIKGGA